MIKLSDHVIYADYGQLEERILLLSSNGRMMDAVCIDLAGRMRNWSHDTKRVYHFCRCGQCGNTFTGSYGRKLCRVCYRLGKKRKGLMPVVERFSRHAEKMLRHAVTAMNRPNRWDDPLTVEKLEAMIGDLAIRDESHLAKHRWTWPMTEEARHVPRMNEPETFRTLYMGAAFKREDDDNAKS